MVKNAQNNVTEVEKKEEIEGEEKIKEHTWMDSTELTWVDMTMLRERKALRCRIRRKSQMKNKD